MCMIAIPPYVVWLIPVHKLVLSCPHALNVLPDRETLLCIPSTGLPFCYGYIDDLLVASTSQEEHPQHLRLVLQQLADHGILVNPSKCVFGVPSLNFLGYHVNAFGIRPMESKVEVIHSFPRPTTQWELREFLGSLNFYHRFIPNGATLLHSLNLLLSCSTPKTLVWREDAISAFEVIKRHSQKPHCWCTPSQ